MINLVHVIMEGNQLDAEGGKSIAYAWQLLSESWIRNEIDNLCKRGDLTVEEWRFVEACLLAASGSLFTSVIVSRYGGEETRIC